MSQEAEAIKEGAKAVQEVAKATTAAVNAAKDGGGWIDGVIGDGLRNYVALHWTDRLAARRLEAAIYDYERLEEIRQCVIRRLQRKGITNIRSAPPRVVIPLIESATMEDEVDLRELWASLLATALDPTSDPVDRKFISTLNELSKADAVTLADIYRPWLQSQERGWSDGPVQADGVEYEGGGSDVDADNLSILTLNRLGLIRPTYVKLRAYIPPSRRTWSEDVGRVGDPVAVPGDLSVVKLTQYGVAFCKAVMADEAQLE